MTNSFSLYSLVKSHRMTIVGVVILSVLESLLFVAQFYFIGKAVNDLLKDSWNGICLLIILFLGKLLVSYFKQRRIGKTYKNIYDDLVVKAIGKPLSEGEDIDDLSPKNTIVYLITDFFKGDLIKGFETAVRLVLVLIALLVLNETIFLISLVLAFVVFLLYYFQKKNTIRISRDLANEFVKERQVLRKRRPEVVYDYHRSIEKMDNQLQGISGFNLSIIEVLSFVFLIVSMVVLVRDEDENALGTFFAMMYYVMAFSETMFLLPSIYQKYLRMEAMSRKI